MVTAIGLTPPGWLSDPQWALLSLVIFNVWQMLGYYVILLIAGLTQINEELYEAARIDGAGLVRQTWSITIPLLRPSLVFVILMTFVNSIQVFDPIYLLTQGDQPTPPTSWDSRSSVRPSNTGWPANLLPWPSHSS